MAKKSKGNVQQSGKEGKTASAKKEDTTRHGKKPAPETRSTGGAFGQAGEKRVRGELRDMGPDVEAQDVHEEDEPRGSER